MTTNLTPAIVRRGRPPKAQKNESAVAMAPVVDGQDVIATPRSTSKAFPEPTALSEKLFENNMNLAYMIARRRERQTKIPFDTFKTLALIGLLRAARKYDPELINPKTGTCYAFSTHAVPFIDGEIKHFLRKNHSSGVIFPERWRDHAPKVRRLLAEGKSREEVAQITKFSVDEISEIIEAQSCTQEIDLDARGHAHYDPELTDAEIDSPEYLKALDIVERGWIALDWSDQSVMLESWKNDTPKSRRELARRPYDRFHRLTCAIAAGRDLPRGTKQPSLDLVITDDQGVMRSIFDASSIAHELTQLTLKVDD